jgi:hypothetical protein
MTVAEYGDSTIVTGDNGFVLFPDEYQYWILHPWFNITMPDRRVTGYPWTETEPVGYGLHSSGKGSFRTIAAIFG